METNRYYIPSLEEFCVGFEFEHKDPYYDGREEFQKAVVESDNLVRYPDEDEMFNYWEAEHLLSNILYDVKENNIRVKYLDASDIEELGFKLVFSDIGIECWRLGNFELRTDADLGMYIDSGNLYSIFYNPYGKQYNCVFSGIIKNKSELKRVLKMMGAIEQ